MSQTWSIATTNAAFTGEIKKEDTSTTWEYSLDGGNTCTSLPSGFAFTAQFYLGANNKYDCTGGAVSITTEKPLLWSMAISKIDDD